MLLCSGRSVHLHVYWGRACIRHCAGPRATAAAFPACPVVSSPSGLPCTAASHTTLSLSKGIRRKSFSSINISPRQRLWLFSLTGYGGGCRWSVLISIFLYRSFNLAVGVHWLMDWCQHFLSFRHWTRCMGTESKRTLSSLSEIKSGEENHVSTQLLTMYFFKNTKEWRNSTLKT